MIYILDWITCCCYMALRRIKYSETGAETTAVANTSLIVGLLFSTFIECCQWFFWLGSFEFDDLLHNALGAGIGAVIVQRTSLGKHLKEQIVDKKKRRFRPPFLF